MSASVVAQWIKLPLGMLESQIGRLLQVQAAPVTGIPAKVPQRWQKMAQVLWCHPPMWETRVEFLLPGFSLAQLGWLGRSPLR